MISHFSSWFDFSGCAPWRGSSPTRRVSWFENISVSTNKSICLFLYFTKEYCIVLNYLKSSIGEVMWLVTRFPCFFVCFIERQISRFCFTHLNLYWLKHWKKVMLQISACPFWNSPSKKRLYWATVSIGGEHYRWKPRFSYSSFSRDTTYSWFRNKLTKWLQCQG